MPRIKYKNASGEKLYGVTTILSQAMGKSDALMGWAFKQGQAYERGEISSMYEKRDKAADAGTLGHLFIENHIKGLPEPSLEGIEEAVASKAEGCFLAFLKFEEAHKFEMVESEVSLVSEEYQYGGTIDIGAVLGGLSIIDIKTSKGVYLSMKIQVAAYGNLWRENFPDRPTDGYHILQLGEDGSFTHHHYPDLSAEWEMFKSYLAVHKLLKQTGQTI